MEATQTAPSSAMIEPPRAERLAPLDSLRGGAALSVALFSHFQHFGGDKSTYPFMTIAPMAWLYARSWLLVDLFFLLSGMVLTFRYLEPLSQQRIKGREFFFLRLSRLYPLHVATLLVCAAIEWSLLVRHQPTVIYGSNNDLYHFFLQLTYLHTWFEHGWSYNEPSWSVCGEVFVYVLFFWFASRRAGGYVMACLITVFIGIAVETKWSLPLPPYNMARPMVGFFAGSLLFLGMRQLDLLGVGTRFGWSCLVVLALLLSLANLIGYESWVGGGPLVHSLVIFPLVLVVALRVPPIARVLSLRPFTFFGDISYAVYLCHVPLQMLTLTVLNARKLAVPTTKSWVLGVYFVVLVAVATAMHYGVEIPSRHWLRDRTSARARLK
jgi:peptidoglycan/LPS O-acetylase OafA/YrhL